jgi:hypothetical protein
MLSQGDIIRLVVSIVLFGVCIFLFRRKRSLPSTLLLLGSLAYAAKQVFWDLMLFIVPFRMRDQSSYFLHFFYPTSTNARWTATLDHTLFYISIVLFPIGLILYLITATRRRPSEQTREA